MGILAAAVVQHDETLGLPAAGGFPVAGKLLVDELAHGVEVEVVDNSFARHPWDNRRDELLSDKSVDKAEAVVAVDSKPGGDDTLVRSYTLERTAYDDDVAGVVAQRNDVDSSAARDAPDLEALEYTERL